MRARHDDSGGERLRMAYVGPEAMVSSYQPGVELATKAELDVKLFTDVDEARAYLGL